MERETSGTNLMVQAIQKHFLSYFTASGSSLHNLLFRNLINQLYSGDIFWAFNLQTYVKLKNFLKSRLGVELIQIQTKQTLLMALTQAPGWSYDQKHLGPLAKIHGSALRREGIDHVCVSLLNWVDVDFFPSTFPSLCWGVGICQHLQFLKLQIAIVDIFLILQVETREIPVQYKAEILQNVRSNTGTSCPESLCNHHPWRNSELAWARPWAAGSWLEAGPALSRGWTRRPPEVPSNLYSFVAFVQWLIKFFWGLSKWVPGKEGKCRFFGCICHYFHQKWSIWLPVREDVFREIHMKLEKGGNW